MSKFSQFMKANKAEKHNEMYAPTKSLCDENGTPLMWEFRHITSKENETLRDENTIDVPVTGKPNMFRPRLLTNKYINRQMVATNELINRTCILEMLVNASFVTAGNVPQQKIV